MIALMFCHWVFDFVFQTDWMARNKSSSLLALIQHCSVYALFGILLGFGWLGWLILFSSHLFIDGITSKINSYLYKKNEIHYFFVSVGFDQFLHFLVLYFMWVV